MNELYKELKKYGSVKANIDLSKYSTLKIGGKAAFLIEVQKEALLNELLTFLTGEGIRFFILGGGSNILFSDEDFDGVVIKIAISQIEVVDDFIEAWAGAPLALVLNTAVKNGLTGLEWAAGIPGTLGGAIRGNAGAMGQSMKDCIQKVFIWSDGEIKEFSNEKCVFGYRESVFKKETEKVIIKAVLNLKKGEKQENAEVVYTVITRLEIGKLYAEIEKIDNDAFIVTQSVKDIKGGMVKKRPLHD